MFDSLDNARQVISNASKKLLTNGYFIMSIPDSNVIVKRMRENFKKNRNG